MSPVFKIFQNFIAVKNQGLIRIVLCSSNSHKVKMAVKLRTEYGSVLHMPTLKENMREKGGPATGDPYGHKQYSGNEGLLILAVCLFFALSQSHVVNLLDVEGNKNNWCFPCESHKS